MNKNLFVFLPARHVYAHDRLLAHTVLKLFPHWITPNIVSLVRLLGTPVVILLILQHHWIAALVAFALLAFTDAIDGSMARTRAQVTEFGMVFDPLADKVLNGSVIILLVLKLLPLWIGITLLSFECLFISLAIFMRFRQHTAIMANPWGKTKMWLEVLGLLLVLLSLIFHAPSLLGIASVAFIGAIIFAFFSLLAHGI